MRETGYGAMNMKYHDRKRFNEEKVAPSLDQNYRPNFMTVNIRQHWIFNLIPNHKHLVSLIGQHELDLVLLTVLSEFSQ